MPLISKYVRGKKLDYFLGHLPRDAAILEIGCADGWFGAAARARGWTNLTGMDLHPPADIVGDIRQWRALGLEPASFDAIVALEVVEHVECFQECWDLLRPGGVLMLTTPVPHMDWACRLLEALGLNQRRTSPHDHLVYFRDIPLFTPVETRVRGLIAQWGIFRKPAAATAGVSPG
jgi:2-polyprenyl-3-methyl-5-hydroxy-6-metoxy-1,4-benzoquinol methylase